MVVFWVADEAEKQAILADESLPFFTTPHFDRHTSVLLRESRVGELDRDQLAEFVYDAWLARAGKRAAKAWLAERGKKKKKKKFFFKKKKKKLPPGSK